MAVYQKRDFRPAMAAYTYHQLDCIASVKPTSAALLHKAYTKVLQLEDENAEMHIGFQIEILYHQTLEQLKHEAKHSHFGY